MNSEEYVNQVNRLMDLQNVYLQIFLALVAIVLGFLGFLQWRLSTKELDNLKEKTKQETIREVEKALGVSNLNEFRSNIKEKVDDVEKEQYRFGYAQLDYEITKLYNGNELLLWQLTYIMDVYRNQILKSYNDFNYFVSRIDSLILTFPDGNEKSIDIHSRHIDNIIQKMSEFESVFDEKSEALESFQNHVLYYRNKSKSEINKTSTSVDNQ